MYGVVAPSSLHVRSSDEPGAAPQVQTTDRTPRLDRHAARSEDTSSLLGLLPLALRPATHSSAVVLAEGTRLIGGLLRVRLCDGHALCPLVRAARLGAAARSPHAGHDDDGGAAHEDHSPQYERLEDLQIHIGGQR
eukprot:CAMPEP_0182831606 /NCGR_PEP_ID=MMETSP0006_2-20121128/19233_1 /TAXON_ID=97485 /ORGANISM="Prymnesium parvum, Strain Texoma1" /LENGTH=135 /DNA_ID=CAMNT_0024959321 /DNA_START=143 /DNA_END=546 /DNA_ORIENTATION=+